MARSARLSIRPALLLALALLVASCTTPEIIRETPQPGPTATETLVPIETAVPPTGTPVVESPRRQIERIAFATDITDDGAPEDERSVIPEGAESFYLCVQVSEVKQGSRFQAIWFEGGRILGRSEKQALEDASEPVWIAMQYRPIGTLNPALEHAVELVVDNEPVERLVFRVGIGAPADVVAAAGFTTGFDALGRAINPQTYFPVDSPQLTLRVRVSNQVDPAGMLFSTMWFRGDTQIAQRAPDGASADPRRFDFTLAPASPLPPGDYRVALLLNGTEVRSIPFVLTDGPLPTPTPTPEPTRTPRPGTPTPTGAVAEEIVIASRVNAGTQQPLDGPIDAWEGEPGGVASLWVAVAVRDVSLSDTIEVVVMQDDEYYGSVTLRETTMDEGWLAGRVELEVPAEDDPAITYTFQILVNSAEHLETTLELSAES